MLKGQIFRMIFLLITQLSGICTAATTNYLLKDPRIKDGTVAGIGSARNQVSLRLRSYEEKAFGFGHICGGSLISDNVVLTAAHCFLQDTADISFGKAIDYIVVIGNLNRFERNQNTLVFKILELVLGNFNHYFDEDIALIILEGAVPANHPTITPIILNDGPLKKNAICHVTGWGITEEDEYSTMLKIVDIPIIDSKDCRDKTSYGSRIHNGMFCAGYLKGGPDACEGDSGGPLVCNGIQTGIVSWGNGCGAPLKPTVFTSVAFYKRWILQQITIHKASVPKFASILYEP